MRKSKPIARDVCAEISAGKTRVFATALCVCVFCRIILSQNEIVYRVSSSNGSGAKNGPGTNNGPSPRFSADFSSSFEPFAVFKFYLLIRFARRLTGLVPSEYTFYCKYGFPVWFPRCRFHASTRSLSSGFSRRDRRGTTKRRAFVSTDALSCLFSQ